MKDHVNISEEQLLTLRSLVTRDSWRVLEDYWRVWLEDLHMELENNEAPLEELRMYQGSIVAVRNMLQLKTIIEEELENGDGR
jgi:hypothetical protein